MRISLNLTMAAAVSDAGLKQLQSGYLQNAIDAIKDNGQTKLDCLSMKAANSLDNGNSVNCVI